MNPKEDCKVPVIALIEQSLVAGLQMVPIEKRNPFSTNSKGIGEVIVYAYKKGAREVYLGVGGSSTVDFGIGAMHALGVNVFEENGKKFPESAALTGGDIKKITDIEYSNEMELLPGLKLKILTDVNNSLLGPDGAVYVYGKQKGAKDEDLPILEGYMKKLSDMFKEKSKGKIRLDEEPKMGAAGAIGAGLSCFIPSEFYNGIQLIAELSGLEEAIKNCDVAITGEGAFDTQTLQGKTVSHVIDVAKKYGKKVIVLCGVNKVPKDTCTKLGIDIYDLKSRFTPDECFKKTKECIYKIIETEIKQTLQ